jgi:hypothetical protein
MDRAMSSQFGDGGGGGQDVPDQVQRDFDIVYKELNMRKTQIM